MSYEIVDIPGEPIVQLTLFESFDMAQGPETIEKLIPILDAQPSPVFYIADLRWVQVSFGFMVGLLGDFTKGSTAFLKHPNIKEVIVITTSEMVALGVKALRQQQYGNLPVSVFGSTEEAFDYVREHLAVHQE